MPAVRYSLSLSPDGAVLTMLRRDGKGTYWIGSPPFAALRAGPVWFVAVNGTMFGLRLKGDSLVLMSKPVPPVS